MIFRLLTSTRLAVFVFLTAFLLVCGFRPLDAALLTPANSGFIDLARLFATACNAFLAGHALATLVYRFGPIGAHMLIGHELSRDHVRATEAEEPRVITPNRLATSSGPAIHRLFAEAHPSSPREV